MSDQVLRIIGATALSVEIDKSFMGTIVGTVRFTRIKDKIIQPFDEVVYYKCEGSILSLWLPNSWISLLRQNKKSMDVVAGHIGLNVIDSLRIRHKVPASMSMTLRIGFGEGSGAVAIKGSINGLPSNLR